MAWETQPEVLDGFADEAQFVTGLRAGRSEAFEALHAAYAAPIYNLALRIVDDPQDAEDVAQEVLLKVFRGLPGDETPLNLPAWLYRVTVNAAFDLIRTRKRRPATVAEDAACETTEVLDGFEQAELSRRVESTLQALPKRQQLALVLRDVHGLSVGETASVLGLTKGSADVLLSRARSGFRRLFLAGTGSLSGRCDRADKALAAGVGRGEPVPAALLEHSHTCPDCRRAVGFWGAAPVGLGILLPQVALPAKLSLGALMAAAQAAGIGVSAGLGAGAAGATASAAATTAAGSGVACGTSAAAATTGAAGAGLLATLGSAAGVKVATLAAVATAAMGIAGVSTHRAVTTDRPGNVEATSPALIGGVRAGEGAGGLGSTRRERGQVLSQAERRRGGSGPAQVGRRDGRGDGSAQNGPSGSRANDRSGSPGSSGSRGGGSGATASGSSAGSARGSSLSGSQRDAAAGSGSAQTGGSGQDAGSGASGGGHTGGSGGGPVSGG